LLGCATTRLTMCELNCYIYKVPRVILAYLYAVSFTACDWCAVQFTLKYSRAVKIYVFGCCEDALAEAPCAYFHPLEGYAGRC
jgi:hypothetical protein